MTKTAKTCLKLTEEDPDLEGVTNFFSARNEGGYLDMMAFNVNISSHPTSELDHLVFTRRTAEGIWLTSPEETVKQREYTAQGMYAHRSFKMPSRPGCSGSPIFDGKGRLYGVNVRGSEPGTDMHDICGDVSICIPVSQIFEARNAVASLIEERIANRPRDLDY